jgi:hypothetical protein
MSYFKGHIKPRNARFELNFLNLVLILNFLININNLVEFGIFTQGQIFKVKKT